MNKRNIKSILNKKINDIVESITDEEVKEVFKHKIIITGGALVSLLQGEKPNDYDIYFKDFESCNKVVEYYIGKFNENHNVKAEIKYVSSYYDPARDVNKHDVKWISLDKAREEVTVGGNPLIKIFIKSDGVAGDNEEDEEDLFEMSQTNIDEDTDIEKELSEGEKYVPKFLTSNAISLSGKIQLIIRFYGEPDKIHENYDFVHCKNYWTSWEDKVVTNAESLEAIINKELIYVGSKYPLCSIIRTRKFIKRGWTINAGQYVKMALQLNEMDLGNVEVLEEQLTGVDSAYFSMMIDKIKEAKGDEDLKRIDSSYVISILNKMF